MKYGNVFTQKMMCPLKKESEKTRVRGKRNHKFRTLVRSDLGDTGVYMTADSLFDAKSKQVLNMIMISDNKYLHILLKLWQYF